MTRPSPGGARLRELVRGGDVIGRTGADELAVVMPGSTAVGRPRRGRAAGRALEHAGPVTVSAGIAADHGTAQLDGLLADAAEVLERARQAGGGRVGMPGRPSRQP